MKVWISPQIKGKNRFAIRMVLGTMGIVILAVSLVLGVTILTIYTDEYKEMVSFVSCILSVVLLIFLSAMLGRSIQRDAMIFCKDGEDRLFVVDARQAVQYRRGIFGYIGMMRDIQKQLEVLKQQIERENALPVGAVEIQKVDRIQDHDNCYALTCQVRYQNERTGKRTYILIKGYEYEGELLRLLERKQLFEVELKENRNPFLILLSLSITIIFVLLSVLSHPYNAQLDERFYFPCLGIASAALCSMIYFIIKNRRGE